MSARFLPAVFGVLLQSVQPGVKKAAPVESPTGSLMAEHGLAERIMLIYERSIKDWKSGEEIDLSLINRTARIARSCIAGYHEQKEELYLYPLFREEGYLADMVDALERQHEAGLEATDKIIDLSSPGRIKDETHMNILMTLCRSYLFMYRPHIARENTELFPKLYDIASAGSIGSIAEKMASAATETSGKNGFGNILRDLAEIEQSLGIHDISEYTIGYG